MNSSSNGSTRRAWALPVALAAAIVAVSLPRLAGAQAGDPLAEAEAAYGQVDFENALRYAQEALEGGGLTPSQLVRVYELIGISATALEQPERARDAYVRMLALDPEAQLDRTLSPSLRGPFMEARGYWAAHADRLEASADLARQRGALRIDLSDPLRMGRTIVVRARVEGEDAYSESRVSAAETTYVEIAGAAAADRVEYSLVVLDEYGNRLITEGNDDVPEVAGRAPEPTPGPGPGPVEPARPVTREAWFWVVIGVVIAAAVGGGVAAGVILADQADTVTVATDVSTAF